MVEGIRDPPYRHGRPGSHTVLVEPLVRVPTGIIPLQVRDRCWCRRHAVTAGPPALISASSSTNRSARSVLHARGARCYLPFQYLPRRRKPDQNASPPAGRKRRRRGALLRAQRQRRLRLGDCAVRGIHARLRTRPKRSSISSCRRLPAIARAGSPMQTPKRLRRSALAAPSCVRWRTPTRTSRLRWHRRATPGSG